MKRIGIMGGTFDPIHNGHLMIAEAVRVEYKLDKVLFIPSANPPHKRNVITSSKHRFNMTLLATCSNPYFEVSSIEIEAQTSEPSYTIETIIALHKIYGPNTEFYFIVGADCLGQLPTWHRFDELKKLCTFIVTQRPNYDFELSTCGDGLNGAHIHLLTTPELEISSTDIRYRIANDISIRYLLPEEVRLYIKKENLYL